MPILPLRTSDVSQKPRKTGKLEEIERGSFTIKLFLFDKPIKYKKLLKSGGRESFGSTWECAWLEQSDNGVILAVEQSDWFSHWRSELHLFVTK